MKKEEVLYSINRNVQCRQCQSKGAVVAVCGRKSRYEVDPILYFGGTAPWECLNCDAKGLVAPPGVDFKLEGFTVMFDDLKKTLH